MKPKTKALAAAVTGGALGIAGLTALAMPADAGERPELPAISAEELATSAVSAELPDFAGTIAVDNQLGLPKIPGADITGIENARVWHEDDKARVSMRKGSAEQTVVRDGERTWIYDSGKNVVTRYDGHKPGERTKEHGKEFGKDGAPADPAELATGVLKRLEEYSTVSVDGTARVAERPAYELVLTPKPPERTLLREVRVAIDSETRIPLRFQVFANGTPDAVLSAGFTEFTVGDQDDELFNFVPPKGAEVVDGAKEARKHQKSAREQGGEKAAKEFGQDLNVVGEGWDTVVTGTVPAEALEGGSGEFGSTDPRALLEQVGKRVSGEFGKGYVITTGAGTALLTDDGRFAAGAVPQQVLIEALDSE